MILSVLSFSVWSWCLYVYMNVCSTYVRPLCHQWSFSWQAKSVHRGNNVATVGRWKMSIISLSVFKVISITVSVSFFIQSFLYVGYIVSVLKIISVLVWVSVTGISLEVRTPQKVTSSTLQMSQFESSHVRSIAWGYSCAYLIRSIWRRKIDCRIDWARRGCALLCHFAFFPVAGKTFFDR